MQQRLLHGLIDFLTSSLYRSLDCVDESVINYDLIEDVLRLLLIQENQKPHSLRAPEGADVSRGSVLIFMPGLGEIRSLADRLQGSRSFMACSLDIVPLHSSLSSADQRKAFRPADEGRRKIIITTNIAETSGEWQSILSSYSCSASHPTFSFPFKLPFLMLLS